MTRLTYNVHGTQRAADWRDSAACRSEDPEDFYPVGATPAAKDREHHAKAVCRRCPSVESCLQWALETVEEWGVWGGLSETERRRLRRRSAERAKPVEPVAEPVVKDTEPVAEAPPKPARPATLAEAWKARTRPLKDGHLGWSGSKMLYYNGAAYTPKQAAYLLHRGVKPHGHALPTCGVDECIRPDHLADAQERARMHGSRPGYQRHLANGETPCGDCRQANTDADNRLRRTGTTKVAS